MRLWLGAAILAALFAGSALAQDKDKAKEADKPADKVLRGDATCTGCHDENDGNVLAIGKSKHGTRADLRTPTCTSCHGESKAHLQKPASGSSRARPDITFAKTSKTSVEARNQACLTCHQSGKRIHWQMSQHANRDVACSSCHQLHTGQDRVRIKVEQADVCFSCHTEIRTLVNRQSHHPVREGKVACSDCHNSHGSAGEKSLVRDSINETCTSCHMEKRGPFVRTHQPVQENCVLCHNPHGSIHDNMLKMRTPFLCNQCHEPTSHRGRVGGATGTGGTSPGIGLTMARGCLNCHTNIHGTNNPRDVTNERTFRR